MNSTERDPSVLLGVSTSLKPGPGRPGRSATRALLTVALEAVRQVTPHVRILDLREQQLPFFDGRQSCEYDDPVVERVWSEVNQAGSLLLSVPCYWAGVSGVFKNFIDVLCGPAYDFRDGTTTVFAGKPIGCLVVGADVASAEAGVAQVQQILLSTGARLVGEPVVVANPRAHRVDMKIGDLIALAAGLARCAIAHSK